MHEYIETSKRITSFTKSYRLDVVFCNKGYRCQTKLGSLGKKDFMMPHDPRLLLNETLEALLWAESICGEDR